MLKLMGAILLKHCIFSILYHQLLYDYVWQGQFSNHSMERTLYLIICFITFFLLRSLNIKVYTC